MKKLLTLFVLVLLCASTNAQQTLYSRTLVSSMPLVEAKNDDMVSENGIIISNVDYIVAEEESDTETVFWFNATSEELTISLKGDYEIVKIEITPSDSYIEGTSWIIEQSSVAWSNVDGVAVWTGNAKSVPFGEPYQQYPVKSVTVYYYSNPDRIAADSVIELLLKLPQHVTIDDENAIVEARAAYEALTEAQKAEVPEDDLSKLKLAESALEKVKIKVAEDKAAAAPVVDLINAIGEVTKTIECYQKICDAQEAYSALTSDQRKYVTNHEVLIAIEGDAKMRFVSTINISEELEIVDGKVSENGITISNVSGIYESEYSGEKFLWISGYPLTISAKNGHGILTKVEVFPIEGDQESIGWIVGQTKEVTYENIDGVAVWIGYAKSVPVGESNSYIIKSIVVEYLDANQVIADIVIELINNLPEQVTLDDEKAVAEVRNVYETLTDAQKEDVSAEALSKLETAEATIENAKKKIAEDKAVASAFVELVNNLPKQVTVDDEDAIAEASKTYVALTEDQKEYVSAEVLSKLETAETALENAKKKIAEDKAAAGAVVELIDAIGEVTFTPENYLKVTKAREAYDALTEAQKELVTNYETLTTDESMYDKRATVTALEGVNANVETDGAWYDLSGRKLQGKPATRGLYIHNGKKKLVK